VICSAVGRVVFMAWLRSESLDGSVRADQASWS
jgi:hypothetical protein